MFKYISALCILFSTHYSFAQIFELNVGVDSIPLYDNNREFMAMVDKQYNKLIKEKADSILLYYPIEYLSNYAVIFSKKKGISQNIAFYQYNPPKQRMGKEILKNEILNKISIKSVYDILMDSRVRTIDTTGIFSHDNPIYCQFFFGNKKQLTAGYESKINGIMNLEFINAFAHEQYRIVSRELKKSNIPRLPY